MEVNNIELIRNLIDFSKPDTFYYIQIIQRRKDCPDLSKSEIRRDSKFITSLESFDRYIPRLIKICEEYSARAYISLSPRSNSNLLNSCAQEYLKRVFTKEVKRPWVIPEKMALDRSTEISKEVFGRTRWIIDCDESIDLKNLISDKFQKLTNVHQIIPTPNGFHLWVDAFNPKDIKKSIEESCTIIEISNTILYFKS